MYLIGQIYWKLGILWINSSVMDLVSKIMHASIVLKKKKERGRERGGVQEGGGVKLRNNLQLVQSENA